MSSALSGHKPINKAFIEAQKRFNHFLKNGGPSKESAESVNWAVDDAINEFDNALNSAEKAGISAFLAVQLRNSLMHAIDDSINIYSDRQKCIRIFGIMVAVIRLSQHCDERSFSTY